VLAFLLFAGGLRSAWAFTQSGAGNGIANSVPMGHEWVTRMAAIELLGFSGPVTAPDTPDPNDPRPKWRQGRARNTNLNSPGAQDEILRIKGKLWGDQRYASRYKAVHDAIIGERWVDLAGYSLTSFGCWDAVAQQAEDVQYDHFMRRYDDRDGDGGVRAAEESRKRFIKYFVAAAVAPPANIFVYDGGLSSTQVEVDRNYFLFGRAIHLFQDSFSPEHTVRTREDMYMRVRQVKSFLCAAGSEQHTHSHAAVLNYSSGDVIWKPSTGIDSTWSAYKPSNMKEIALVATEATKDLWAAFIRTMGLPRDQRGLAARQEAETLARNWLGYDAKEMSTWYDNQPDLQYRDDTYVLTAKEAKKRAAAPLGGGVITRGMTVRQCMSSLNVGTEEQEKRAEELRAQRRKCLYNARPASGYSDLFDTSIKIWLQWGWRSLQRLEEPAAGWEVPSHPADSGVRIRIGSPGLTEYMNIQHGINGHLLSFMKKGRPLELIKIGSDETSFRVANEPGLFLAMEGGKLVLTNSNRPHGVFQVSRQSNGWSIAGYHTKELVLMDHGSPQVKINGDPTQPNAQWNLSSPESELVAGGMMETGQFLTSPDGRNQLRFENTGNLCFDTWNTQGLWCSDTEFDGGTNLFMQDDGNLCLYTATDKFVWCARNKVGKPGAKLVVLDEGNVCIVEPGGVRSWCAVKPK
jgi:hypothetical protein